MSTWSKPLSSDLGQMSQSRPDSGLDLSHLRYESLYNHLSCSLPARYHPGKCRSSPAGRKWTVFLDLGSHKWNPVVRMAWWNELCVHNIRTMCEMFRKCGQPIFCTTGLHSRDAARTRSSRGGLTRPVAEAGKFPIARTSVGDCLRNSV